MEKTFNTIPISGLLTTLDWIIFFLILLITVIAILYGHYKKKIEKIKPSPLETILLGRQLTLPLFVATLVATWYGGIFGVTQIAFESGIYNFITQGVFWYITYLIFAFFLVKKIRSYKALTLPHMLEKTLGKKAQLLASFFNFVNVIPIAYTIGLGLFLKMLFGGTLLTNMTIGVLFVLFYSSIGGLRAIVFSDLIQFFVMCISVFLVVVFAWHTLGGWSYLTLNLPPNHFKILGHHSLGETLSWGLIALSTLVDPNFYHRCFAAKSDRVAQKGIVFATIIWFLFDICTTTGAMYARAALPSAASSEAYVMFAIQILPNGLRGFFLAGILATILSTLDSYIFLANTTLVFDIFSGSTKKKKFLNLFGPLMVGILSIVLATNFEGNTKAVWKTISSYSTSCLLMPVLLSQIFPKKISENSFLMAAFFGAIGITLWKAGIHLGLPSEIDALYIGLLGSAFGMLLLILIEKVGPRSTNPIK